MATQTNQPSRMSIWEYIRGDGKQLVIPVYQRNYSWTPNKGVKRLLDDMKSVVEKKTDSHFTGIFMTVNILLSARFSQIQLVDGQQRLTTLFLLLWALKEVYSDDPSLKDVNDMLYNSEVAQRQHGEKYSLKLKPLISDDDVYQKIAINSSLPNNQKKTFSDSEKASNVYQNYEFIVKYLKSTPIMTVDAVLDALAKMDVVIIPLDPNEDDPQQIFESINALGLPLAPIDLIRNLVLMGMESDEQDTFYFDYWKPIEDVFDIKNRDSLSDLFRLYISIKEHELVKSDDLYLTFYNSWKKNIKTLVDKQNFASEVLEYTKHYKELYFDGDFYPVNDSKSKQIILDFRRLNYFTIAPYVLEAYHLYRQNKVKEDSFVKIINLMNSYIIRRECAGYQMNDVSRFFPQLLRNVERESNGNYDNIYQLTLKYLVNMNKNNNLGLPNDERIKNFLLTNNAYTLSHIMMILTRIENSNNNTPIVDTSSLSIEHVMPQTQDDPSYWRNVIGKEYENYDVHCNKIGNLTLVSVKDNSGMRNHSFDRKKEYLAQSRHIKLNEDILAKNEWNVKEIDDRTQKMIDLINKEFKYESMVVDKKISYEVIFKKEGKNCSYECDAKMFMGGNVVVQKDCLVSYKEGSKYMDNIKIRDALQKGFLEVKEDKSVVLKQDSQFDSIESLTEIMLGEMPKKFSHLWSVDDGVSIDNIISLLR
ncbi:MAG: DUF262 domain-containing protein [Acholeplasmatales bacterium]|nr:DUF262 domain-containing protein [Acholeplasmatales bacterium]